MGAGRYETVNEDSVSDLGLQELFSEPEGVVTRKRDRGLSWPSLRTQETEKQLTYEEWQIPELLIYKNDAEIFQIQATRAKIRELAAANDTLLIRRLVDLKITGYTDKETASTVASTVSDESVRSDEVLSDVMSDYTTSDGVCSTCGCDCRRIYDMLTKEKYTQTGQCNKCGEERHDYKECPASNSTCTNCYRKGHLTAFCRSRSSRQSYSRPMFGRKPGPSRQAWE